MSTWLLDTHVWFWFLTGNPRLPNGLRRLIESSREPCWLSPISVWELAMLHERGRVEIEGSYRSWYEEAVLRFPVQDASLSAEAALVSRELRLPHEDPADRFLAATAIVNGLTLLTVDRRLHAARNVPTRSR